MEIDSGYTIFRLKVVCVWHDAFEVACVWVRGRVCARVGYKYLRVRVRAFKTHLLLAWRVSSRFLHLHPLQQH